jgi:hypothetical protein
LRASEPPLARIVNRERQQTTEDDAQFLIQVKETSPDLSKVTVFNSSFRDEQS